MSATIYSDTIWEDCTATVMARIYDQNGAAITQAGLTSIACAVYDLSNFMTATAVASPTVTIGSSVYDTLQTADARWTEDTTGYNFAHTLSSTLFTGGGKRYRVEYLFTSTSGHKWPLVVDLTTEELLSS